MNPPQTTKTLKVDHLPVKIYKDADSLGKAAALEARRIIQEAIDERKKANIILATGNSQLNFLESLRILEDIEWSKVHVFHMDEYLGIDPKHPAQTRQPQAAHSTRLQRPHGNVRQRRGSEHGFQHGGVPRLPPPWQPPVVPRHFEPNCAPPQRHHAHRHWPSPRP